MLGLSLNDLATFVGLVAGVTALVLGVLNYLRENPKIVIELQWDMNPVNIPGYDKNEQIGMIHISNVGRRPIYLSHVALRLPKGFNESHLLLQEGLQGKSVAEGDAPMIFPVKQEGLGKYASKWREVRAHVSDSTSKVWLSKKIEKAKVPSWAVTNES